MGRMEQPSASHRAPDADPEEETQQAVRGPSGLAEPAESSPLGSTESDPDGEGTPARGPGAMPGIPTDGEPPSAG